MEVLSPNSSWERLAAPYSDSKVATLGYNESISAGRLVHEVSNPVFSCIVASVDATFEIDRSGNASALWSLVTSVVSTLWRIVFDSVCSCRLMMLRMWKEHFFEIFYGISSCEGAGPADNS